MERAPDDLFDFMARQSRGRAILSAFRLRLKRGRDRLVPYVVLSLAVHVTVVGLLAIARGTNADFRSAMLTETREKAIRQALETLRLDARESQVLSEALAGLDQDAYDDVFEHAPELDPRLEERERIEIFRSLMKESLGHLKERRVGLSALDFPPWGLLPGADIRGPIRTAGGDLLYPFGAAPDGRPTLYRLRAAAAKKLEFLRSTGDQEKGTRESRGGKVEVRTERGFARVPDEYYFRECPYSRMIALGGSVFYAVSRFPRLETAAGSETSGEVRDPRRSRAASGSDPRPTDPIKIVYMPASVARQEPAARDILPELPGLSEENVQKILDGLMELSDEDQVRVFMERFLIGRDADDPLLARFTRRFLYENLGGAFNLGDRLSTAFDFLEELFYNKMSQNDLIAYGLKNRMSRTGTEIMLYLAALYDFERRGLAYLVDSLDEIEAVLAGRPGRAEVFNKPAKAFVLGEVYRDFVSGIGRGGQDDLDAVLREYRDEQERIYRLLIDNGGEAGNRARYALGGLYWDEGEENRALKEWQAIDPIFETSALAQLRWIMSLTYGQDLLWSRINAVFREESTKNSTAALERFAKFHLWENRSAKLRAGSAD
jgi:hypothetical protein